MKRLSIFIPSSFSSDERDKKIRVFKIGQLARIASTFRVNNIIIYNDHDKKVNSKKEGNFIKNILLYMEVPQYLRKKIIPLSKKLRYVGVLPPLRTMGHPKENEVQRYREGIVVKVKKGKSYVYIGLKEKFVLDMKLKKGERVIVDLKEKRIVSKEELPIYWSYDVHGVYSSLSQALKENKQDLIIGTSKYGSPLNEVYENLKEDVRENNKIGIVFGAPYGRGLREILKIEGKSPDKVFHYFINTIPNQGVRVVKTEEALSSTLSILNFLLNLED